MIINCENCGIEYSLGRNVCHKCGDNTIFFGAIFGEDRTERKSESIIKVFPEKWDGGVI